MEIRNTTVMITGANRGIGKAVAKSLAADHCHLILLVRTKDLELEAEIKSAGAKSVRVKEVDLSQRSEVEKFVSENKDLAVDILFNNAGVLTGGLLETQSVKEIYDELQVNVASLIHLTHAFLPGMIHRKSGKIINQSSVAAFMHFPSASSYSATKAAVYAFTESLRQELKDTGVSTLNLVTPAIKTRLFDQLNEKFGKHFTIPGQSLPAAQYADMIREAILNDLNVLNPYGITGLGLKIAKYVPQLFQYEVRRRFKR